MTAVKSTFALCALVLVPGVLFAQWHGPNAPDSLSFQGLLTKSDGTPLDSSTAMTFAFYKDANKVWEQTIDPVVVTDGVFNVILGGAGGASLDTVAFNEPIDVGIKVGNGAEMTPRTPLTSAAYALGMRGIAAVYKENNSWRSMNVIGGAWNNRITGGTGITIAGGGGDHGAGSPSANTVGGDFSTISGGHANTITSFDAVIGGGKNNSVGAYDGVVSGGATNHVGANGAAISGGRNNTANGMESVVGGGANNQAAAWASAVGGGSFNTASGDNSTVAGGGYNRALAFYSTVAGGFRDSTSATYAAVGGGNYNHASGLASTIGGGNSNKASGDSSTVAGGNLNLASALTTTIAGGSANRATGNYASIGGGISNTAAERGTVGGGRFNRATRSRSTVAGGNANWATENSSAVGGGENNRAQGIYSTVPGGRLNWATGDYSFAAGYESHAQHDGSFVWADVPEVVDPFESMAANQFLIRARGGVGIGTNQTTPGGLTISRDAELAAYQLEIRNVGSIHAPNHSGITFTQAADGSTELGSIKLIYHSNGRPDLSFSVRDAADALFIEASSGQVGVGTTSPTDELEVNGSITAVSVTQTSDARMKRNVTPITGAIPRIERLRGVTFDWDRERWPERVFGEGRQMGLIAQEVIDVVPEVVELKEDGYYSVAYAKLVPLLIEAVKDQQAVIEDLQARLAQVERKLTP